MSLGGDDLRANLYCCAEVIRSRQRSGRPVPAWLRAHFSRLENQLRMSLCGHKIDCAARQDGQSSHADWISTAEAARHLGLSPRQVQRLALELDAQRVGSRLLFDREEVIMYARRRDE
jgi:hypothetical protein